VEDLVQEVFLQVHRSLADFKGQSKFSTWLHRVTVNVVLMCRRAARSRPVFAGEVTDAEPDRGLLPDEDASRRQRLEAFRRVLEKLPEKKRTVFVLHELEGLPPVEISTIVDAPVLTVRTRLFYARREICELMRSEPTLASLAARLSGERDEAESPAGASTSTRGGEASRSATPEKGAGGTRRAPGEVGPGEVGSGEVGSGEVGPGEVGPGEAGPGKKGPSGRGRGR
jgi:RNA polymerase sigma-70 factor (ECF subfamily)